jgi:ceramide glucosyltransferase
MQVWTVRSVLSSRRETGQGSGEFPFSPPISILKPLKGLEDNLFDNLESFCLQDYPVYEVVLSLQDENDPAYKVCRKIQEKFKEKAISIVVERSALGLNPKVNNLVAAYRHSAYATILISDSNVKVDPHYLKAITPPLTDPDVGLVCNLIRGVGGKTLGSIFENLHLNSYIVGNVCWLEKWMGVPCVIGKSMLMRKADLEAIGGFHSIKDVLAEDHFIGVRIRQRKQRIVVSKHLISNVNNYWGLSKFINRHVRWGKMRWKIGRLNYLAELTIHPVLIALLSILFLGFSSRTASLLAAACAVKMIGDFCLGRIVQASLHPLAYLLVPIKELICGLVWFIPFLSDTVTWRGNCYQIGKDTVLFPCPESGLLTWRYRMVDAIRARFA